MGVGMGIVLGQSWMKGDTCMEFPLDSLPREFQGNWTRCDHLGEGRSQEGYW